MHIFNHYQLDSSEVDNGNPLWHPVFKKQISNLKLKVLQLLRRIFLDPRSSATCAAVLPKTVRFGRLLVTGGRSDLSPHASHAL